MKRQAKKRLTTRCERGGAKIKNLDENREEPREIEPQRSHSPHGIWIYE